MVDEKKNKALMKMVMSARVMWQLQKEEEEFCATGAKKPLMLQMSKLEKDATGERWICIQCLAKEADFRYAIVVIYRWHTRRQIAEL